MKIAYVAYLDTRHGSGVAGKIAEQVDFWRTRGTEVRLFLLSPGGKLDRALAGLPVERAVHRRFPDAIPKTHRLVKRALRWAPDLVYIRFGMYAPSLTLLTWRIASVLEINTDDLAECAVLMDRQRYAYHRFQRELLLRSAKGLVFVSQELAAKFRHYGKAGIVVSNGIDLSRCRPLPARGGGSPRLIFVGSPYPWNGIDKLVTLARCWPQCRFDVVGYDRSDLPAEVPDNVHCHGHMCRDQYEPLLSRADVALGPLALERKGVQEASPLKVREYLASGLPAVIAHRDSDFPGLTPFLLQTPNNGSNAADVVDAIRPFVDEWKGRRVPRPAIGHLDAQLKEARRFEFLREVAVAGAAMRPRSTTVLEPLASRSATTRPLESEEQEPDAPPRPGPPAPSRQRRRSAAPVSA